MTDFLLELRSEEIPARMQDRAREDLARLFTTELTKAGIAAGELTTYATPRRLALIARDLPPGTLPTHDELKGPPLGAPEQAISGFLNKAGLPREALFTKPDAKGRETYFAHVHQPGRATSEVLAEAVPAIIRAFPWPKAMRWGDASLSTESLRWVRPLHGIVALFGEEIVPVTIADVESGAATLGHRFHHSGQITIGSAADYVEKLRACHVIVDQDERRAIIRDQARQVAAEAGLEVIEDEGLVTENAGLTEWPVPLLGRFDPAFLDVPPEVIQLTARVNQKYFVCRAADGKLANAFVCTANIAAADDGARIVEGNRKVLAARLSDARFFYETDLKVPLAEQAKKLDRIIFHEKLGTVADKVERVAKLARWLVEEGIVGNDAPAQAGAQSGAGGAELPPARKHMAALAERAARLAKADLVTGMVGEFPELQGVMGGYYAAAQGEDPQVAAAIRDHYKPVGQGDEVPTAPVTVAVSLADKLDSFFCFFTVGEKPSGSRDPFALRRSTLGVLSLPKAALPLAQIARFHRGLLIKQLSREYEAWESVFDKELALNPSTSDRLSTETGWLLRVGDPLARQPFLTWPINEMRKRIEVQELGAVIEDGSDFFLDRLKVQQREAGVRHDLIDAVFALGGEDDLVRLLARVCALQAFVGTEDGANLLAGYKRAANILKKEGFSPSPRGVGRGQASEVSAGEGQSSPEGIASTAPLPASGEREKALSYTPEKDEAALIAALDSAEPAAARAVGQEDFEAAMAALATLRAPIDAFFDTVTVNDPDPAKRSARLALLARVRDAVHSVADFSKIEG